MDSACVRKEPEKPPPNGLQMHYMRFNLRPVWGTGLDMKVFLRRRMGFTTHEGFLVL